MDAKTISEFSIRKYLAGRGIHPAKDRGYYGLYHSPLREDRNPSMKVDYDKNLWIDYGAGEGGTLIDLVMRMERCDAGTAMRLLEQQIGDITTFFFQGDCPALPERIPSIIVEDVLPLEIPACSLISWGEVSTSIRRGCIARRCIIVWRISPISLSDSAMMPEDGNCATAISRAVRRRLRRPETAVIRHASYSRVL